MSKTNYYFVARNRMNHELQILPFDGKSGHRLEEIDLFTTQYDGEKDLARSLHRDGLLDFLDADFFIAHQSKNATGVEVVKEEVLYSNQKEIREIAKNSCEGNIRKSGALIDSILDQFAQKMCLDSSFFLDVVSNRTNIYSKYIHYFPLRRMQNPKDVKYQDGSWARFTYPLIRNILEATSRKNVKYSRISDTMHRDLADLKLRRVTSTNYDVNQLSIFDEFPDEKRENQLIDVVLQLEKIPKDTFVLEEDHNVFSPSFASICQEGDFEQLSELLPEDLRKALRLFTTHRDSLEECSATIGNSQQVPIQLGFCKIVQLLKENPDTLQRAALWCQFFQKYQDQTLGEENGRGVQKRKE